MLLGTSPAWGQLGVQPTPVTRARPIRVPGNSTDFAGFTQTFDVPSIDNTALTLRRAGTTAGNPFLGAYPNPGIGRRSLRMLPRLGTITGQFHQGFDPFARQGRLLYRFSTGDSFGEKPSTLALQNVVPARPSASESEAQLAAPPVTEGMPISEYLTQRVTAYRRDRTADGWAYLNNENLVRAMAAFRSAEAADREAPMPRFGQLITAVVAGQYHSALTLLERIRDYEESGRSDPPSMLEYDVVLQDLVGGDEEAVDELLIQYKRISERALEDVRAQALYAYLLWYGGTEEAAREAIAVADRIARNHPASTWARLAAMMRETQRPRQANAAGDARAADDRVSRLPPRG